jgi:PPPDE putative peptidase domain
MVLNLVFCCVRHLIVHRFRACDYLLTGGYLDILFLLNCFEHFFSTVHGMEYGFGAHEYPSSGVFEVEPKKCPGFIYRSSIQLGRINMAPDQFREFIEGLACDYYGDTYHLISKNCNHFTDDVSSKLVGRHIPGWVNRLAKLGVCVDR